MGNFFRKNKLELLLFILFYLILAFSASKTFLFFDDINFGFPAVTKDYLNFYQNYLNNYGFFRPLALVYYFFIYEIFLILPNFTHLIPLTILTLTSLLIFKALSQQGLSKKQSLAAGVFFLSLPFVTESYSWLSANTSIIVLFIFFYQIFLIERNIVRNNLLRILLTLQLISVFFYESTIFMSIALAYLLYIKGKIKNKFHLTIFSITPIFAYLISKIVIRPQFENRSRFITISDAISHWRSFLSQLKMLFSHNYLQNFWRLEFVDGLNFIKNSPFIIIMLVLLLLLILNRLFRKEKKYKERIFQPYLFFWLLTFILSLIPLSWQTDYLPFRTLILPTLIIIICIFFTINLISFNNKIEKTLCFFIIPSKIIFILIIFVFMIIQISMVNQYINQFLFDKKIVLEINKKLEDLGFEHPNRSNLILKNFYSNNVGRIVYADYIYGLFHNYWSAEAILDLNSGSFARIGIELPRENIFSSRISKEKLLQLRPLTIMSFTNNEACVKTKCLTVEQVIK